MRHEIETRAGKNEREREETKRNGLERLRLGDGLVTAFVEWWLDVAAATEIVDQGSKRQVMFEVTF